MSLLATRERPGTHARSITVVVHDDHDASAPSLTSAELTHVCAQGMMASGDACVPEDIGTPADAGTEDAGTEDAGSPMRTEDAAVESDAGVDPGATTKTGGCSTGSTRDAGALAWLAMAVAMLVVRSRRSLASNLARAQSE